MATKQLVTKVWIDPGCIICDACESTAPDVFEVQHENDTCIIRPAALDAEDIKEVVVKTLGFALFIVRIGPFARELGCTGSYLIPIQAHLCSSSPSQRRSMLVMSIAGKVPPWQDSH